MINTVLDAFEITLDRYPDAPAFEDENSALTFRDLYTGSQVIASRLAAALPPRTPVLVYMPKSPEMIRAFLGVPALPAAARVRRRGLGRGDRRRARPAVVLDAPRRRRRRRRARAGGPRRHPPAGHRRREQGLGPLDPPRSRGRPALRIRQTRRDTRHRVVDRRPGAGQAALRPLRARAGRVARSCSASWSNRTWALR